MNRDYLRAEVRNLLEATTGRRHDRLNDRQDLRTGLGLDSVDMMGLVLEAQERLGVHLSLAELEQVRTIGQLLELLQRRMVRSSRAAA